MLAFRGMSAVRKLRGAGLTAFIASFLAMNCGEEEFNLLPIEQESARGGSTTGGETNTGGFGLVPPETGGAPTGGRASSGGRGPTGGAVASGGRGGTSSGPGCVAPACCTRHDDCGGTRPFCLADRVCHECYLADDRSTVGCGENEVCGVTYRCYPGCVTGPCPDGLKFASRTLPCVECLTDEDCEGKEPRSLCLFNSCVACRSDADCPAFKTCSSFYTCV
jgi:hypothetical protein